MSFDSHLLWGKLGHAKDPDPPFHPLLCHMLDVAAVAEAMWELVLPAIARERFAAAFALPEAPARTWLAFLAGLHDLGKASPAFQCRREARVLQRLYGALPPPPPDAKAPHGQITASELPQLLVDQWGLPASLARRLATTIGGHHGTFPTPDETARLDSRAVGRRPWAELRRAVAQELAQALGVPTPAPTHQLDHAAALVLAGLVSVADWIGSNERLFPYAVAAGAGPRPPTAADYLPRARAQARRALDELLWSRWRPPAEPWPFARLFPGIATRRPLQDAVIELAPELLGPSLVIIEAPMGEGKTEAALFLADTWGAQGIARGCYFALPTQATSNQMFERVRTFLDQRYPDDVVNLQLLHGHAALSAEFQLLRDHAERLFTLDGVVDEGGAASNVVAGEWFTYRKRGLLAPFGVGTVDQALLAVLQTRHGFVRLFGLDHKVAIVDEVHAYDAYMSTLLERLLEWLAALRSPVVLLSATLPTQRRDALLRAYAHGLGLTAEAAPPTAYPRLSWVSARGTGAREIATSAENTRTLQLAWTRETAGDPTSLAMALCNALAEGGCAAVVCNTVARAQAVYQALRPHFASSASDGEPLLDLFHARFLFTERDARERRALRRFGRPPADGIASRSRPDRAVLVATQVIEQSLDLDFDLLVSDLAPVDLVLQRAGRLHRHQRAWRPPHLQQPTVWLRAVEERDGVPQFDRGSAAVYAEHLLLRSWLALRACDHLRIPADVADLIQQVYGEDSPPADLVALLAERWNHTREELEAARRREQDEAQARYIKRPGYSGEVWALMPTPRAEDEPDLHPAHQALTRLTAPSVSVVLAYGSEGRPTLDPLGREAFDPGARPDRDETARLLRHSLDISSRRVLHALETMPVPHGWQRSSWLRRHRLLVLDERGEAPVGDWVLRLDPDLGLLVLPKGGATD